MSQGDHPTSQPEANQSDIARHHLVPAYEVGRLLNELVWNLQQSIIVDSSRFEEHVQQTLTALAVKVIEMAPELDAGDRLKTEVGELKSRRQATIQLEDYAESIATTRTQLEQSSASDYNSPIAPIVIDEQLAPLLDEWVYPDVNRLRQALQDELRVYPQLHAALLLGEYLDQGVRARDVYLHVAELGENPAYREQGVERADWKQPDPLEISEEKSSAPHGALEMQSMERSRRFCLRWRARDAGDLPFPDSWAAVLQAYWNRVGLPAAGLPTLTADTASPAGRKDHVDRVDQAFRDAVPQIATTNVDKGPEYQFQLIGEIWNVRFGSEYGQYQDDVGMRHIARLLDRAGKMTPALFLAHIDGKGEVVDAVFATLDEMEPDGEADPDEPKSLSLTSPTVQRVYDDHDEYFAEKRQEYEQSRDKAQAKGDLAAAQTWAAKCAEITAAIDANKGAFNRYRQLGSLPAGKAADAVAKALKRAYDKLNHAGSFRLAVHLKRSIARHDVDFRYLPEQRLPWKL